MESQSIKTPSLRYPEFVETWRDCLLGDYLDFKNGFNAEKSQYGVGKKFVNVLDIINDSPIVNDSIIGSVTMSEAEFKNYEVRYGDILFQRSSETREEVGQSNVYLDKDSTAAFGGFVIRGNAKQEYDPLFFHYLLKTDPVRKDITSRSGGSTRYNIGQESLKAVSIVIPTQAEQQKIAAFLSSMDKKIEQLARKKELLLKYKKGVMQQIFDQKLRFKDDDGNDFPDWEEMRIGDVFEVTRGRVLAMVELSDLQTNEYPYPVYSSQTINQGLAGYFNHFLFENCITWTTDGAGAGDVNFRKGKFYCTNVCGVLRSDSGYANQFVAELLNTKTRKHVSYVGNPKLMNNVMAQIKLVMPKSVKEQRLVSNFFESIDARIDLVKKQLLKTRTFKKGLLQQMFV